VPVTRRIKTDVCVIGAGSGGLSVAAGAVQMGAKVVLLEGHLMGGDCLNFGCVPSKALIAAGKQAHAMRTGEKYGVAPVMPEVSYAAAKDHVRRVIDTIAPVDSQERFEGLGVQVIREFGRFISHRGAGGRHGDRGAALRDRHGLAPLRAADPGARRGALPDQRDDLRPARPPVAPHRHRRRAHRDGDGAGAPAARLRGDGDRGREGAGPDDPEAAAVVIEALRDEGIRILEEAQAAQVSTGGRGAIRVETADGQVVEGSHLLVAVGRKANVEGLDLEKAGIAYDRAVKVGADLRTTNRRVYAVGDVAGGPPVHPCGGLSRGHRDPAILFGLPAKAKTAHIPWATYTDPELAQVGMTEAEARRRMGRGSRSCGSPTTRTTAPSRKARRGIHQGDGRAGRPVGPPSWARRRGN
jgi:pyruvate/2-oxoglutarate dehydrogenase complex dihydrolipoamide dehydrogenase (E3) component